MFTLLFLLVYVYFCAYYFRNSLYICNFMCTVYVYLIMFTCFMFSFFLFSFGVLCYYPNVFGFLSFYAVSFVLYVLTLYPFF